MSSAFPPHVVIVYCWYVGKILNVYLELFLSIVNFHILVSSLDNHYWCQWNMECMEELTRDEVGQDVGSMAAMF